jgi:hypothetical protein
MAKSSPSVGGVMPRYRIDLSNEHDRVSLHASFFECGDEVAMVQAISMFQDYHIEVWDDTRLVLECKRPREREQAKKRSR